MMDGCCRLKIIRAFGGADESGEIYGFPDSRPMPYLRARKRKIIADFCQNASGIQLWQQQSGEGQNRQHAVHSVQHAAMTGQKPAAVFDSSPPLHQRFP